MSANDGHGCSNDEHCFANNQHCCCNEHGGPDDEHGCSDDEHCFANNQLDGSNHSLANHEHGVAGNNDWRPNLCSCD